MNIEITEDKFYHIAKRMKKEINEKGFDLGLMQIQEMFAKSLGFESVHHLQKSFDDKNKKPKQHIEIPTTNLDNDFELMAHCINIQNQIVSALGLNKKNNSHLRHQKTEGSYEWKSDVMSKNTSLGFYFEINYSNSFSVRTRCFYENKKTKISFYLPKYNLNTEQEKFFNTINSLKNTVEINNDSLISLNNKNNNKIKSVVQKFLSSKNIKAKSFENFAIPEYIKDNSDFVCKLHVPTDTENDVFVEYRSSNSTIKVFINDEKFELDLFEHQPKTEMKF